MFVYCIIIMFMDWRKKHISTMQKTIFNMHFGNTGRPFSVRSASIPPRSEEIHRRKIVLFNYPVCQIISELIMFV